MTAKAATSRMRSPGYDQRMPLGLSVAGLAGRAAMTVDEIEYTEQGGTGPPSPCCGAGPPPWTSMSACPGDVTRAPPGRSPRGLTRSHRPAAPLRLPSHTAARDAAKSIDICR